MGILHFWGKKKISKAEIFHLHGSGGLTSSEHIPNEFLNSQKHFQNTRNIFKDFIRKNEQGGEKRGCFFPPQREIVPIEAKFLGLWEL